MSSDDTTGSLPPEDPAVAAPQPASPAPLPPAPLPPAATAPVDAEPIAALSPQRANPFTDIAGSAWGRAATTAGIGYLAGLIIATVSVALTWVIAGSGFQPQWMLSGPFQAVALAFGGSLSGSVDVPVLAMNVSGSFGITAIPLFVTVATLVGTWYWTRRTSRTDGVTLVERILLSLATGLVLAAGITALAAAIRIAISIPIPGLAVDLGASAASLPGFLVAFILGSAASYLGRGPVSRRSWFPYGTVRVVALHLGVLVVVTGIVMIIATTVQGAGASLPLGLPFLALNAAVVSMLGVVGAGGTAVSALSSAGMGAITPNTNTSVSLFNGVPLYAWLLFVLALVLAVAAGTLLRVRRNGVTPGALGWVITPLAYAVAGLIVQLLATLWAVVSVTLMGQAAITLTVGPLGWTFLLFALWGAAVEAVSRFVAPSVLGLVGPAFATTASRLTGRDLAPAAAPDVASAADSTPVAEEPVADGETDH